MKWPAGSSPTGIDGSITLGGSQNHEPFVSTGVAAFRLVNEDMPGPNTRASSKRRSNPSARAESPQETSRSSWHRETRRRMIPEPRRTPSTYHVAVPPVRPS